MRPSGSHATALEQPLDLLFADIAIRVQLSQTAHDKAVQRYSTIVERLNDEDSPLAGLINLFYAQGSMAIRRHRLRRHPRRLRLGHGAAG